MVKRVSFDAQPGPVVLFGSGETSHGGGKIFERVAQRLPDSPHIALLETRPEFRTELGAGDRAGSRFPAPPLAEHSPPG